MKKILSFALALLLTLTGLGVHPARAVGSIIYVNDDAAGPVFDGTSWATAYKKLQNAFDVAVSGDQLWVAEGIYYPDEGATHTNNNRGETFYLIDGVALYGGFAGTETQLEQRKPLVNLTILSGDIEQDDLNADGNLIAETYTDIQGSNSYNVVANSSSTVNSTTVLDGFVITAGYADGDPLTLTTVGGGLRFLSGSSPALNNLIVSGNRALANGGGMYVKEGSNPALNTVLFSGNYANLGGGIYAEDSDLTLTKVIFTNNSATSAGGMNITVTSSPVLNNVVFNTNTATMLGGGMAVSNSTPLLTDVTFHGNSADAGGGIYISTLSNPGLTNVTFSQNTAGHYGAGIYMSGSGSGYAYVTITNSTFSGNTATVNGGGMYNSFADAELTNVTFSGNTGAVTGGGLYNTSTSATYFKNVLVANSTGGDCINASGSGTVASYSLIEDAANACGLTNGVDGNLLGQDPKLGLLQNNGGLTKTHALLANSPAINTGTNNACPLTDQTGKTRPQGSSCDIGSYERGILALILYSIGANDGHVLESGENTKVGGAANSLATAFYIGDDAANRQYKAFLHFNTASLPDNAIITRATLKLRKQAQGGTNPFTILGSLKVDMRKPSFGTTGLTANDFQAPAGKTGVATFGATPVNSWYSANLSLVGRNFINRTGTTQFRLYFTTDDNNDNGMDLIKIFSGNYATANMRPTLIIEYYVP